ncbi:MAG TPA: LCP family protein [Streptosporangiaceae bacterium]|nr:LCP family protein [Streptosporangiaceae bacterium]
MSRYDDLDDAGKPEKRGRRGQGSKRQRHSRKARIIGWIAVIVTILVTGTSLAAYAAYLNTVHSIETFSTSTTLGNNRPPSYNSSENILVVGSDSRAGSNRKFGANVQGQRSDTMLILHIRPNHRGAVVISLPRDSEVPVLRCAADGLGDPGQPAQPGATEMLNATFAYGGPPCLWRTVEQETGIHIDHYVGLTFSGFEQVINDIGGVNVCLPEAIKDPKSGINLTAGKHHVGGQQALAFWRERYVGEGSDLQRIQRQQFLMAGLIQEVKSGGLLSSYSKMYSVLRDTAKALTTDQGLSVTDMVSLAEDLRTLTTKSVQFVTVPNGADPTDPNRVVWQQPQADQLFYSIAHDTKLPKTPKSGTPAQTTSPGHVQVDVENGSGQQGVAGQAASELTSRGFKVTGTGNAPNFNYTSNVIEYATPSDMAAVNTLKAQLTGAQVQLDRNLTPGTVYLILGSSFNGLNGSSSGGSHRNSPSTQNLSQTYGGINASTNICKDSSAFAGPDNPANGT